jgi:hypothetical protein
VKSPAPAAGAVREFPFFRDLSMPLIQVTLTWPVLRGAKRGRIDSLRKTERTLLIPFLLGNSRACPFGLFAIISTGGLSQ